MRRSYGPGPVGGDTLTKILDMYLGTIHKAVIKSTPLKTAVGILRFPKFPRFLITKSSWCFSREASIRDSSVCYCYENMINSGKLERFRRFIKGYNKGGVPAYEFLYDGKKASSLPAISDVFPEYFHFKRSSDVDALDPYMGSDPDEIPPSMLKHCHAILFSPAKTHIAFRLGYDLSTVPVDLMAKRQQADTVFLKDIITGGVDCTDIVTKVDFREIQVASNLDEGNKNRRFPKGNACESPQADHVARLEGTPNHTVSFHDTCNKKMIAPTLIPCLAAGNINTSGFDALSQTLDRGHVVRCGDLRPDTFPDRRIDFRVLMVLVGRVPGKGAEVKVDPGVSVRHIKRQTGISKWFIAYSSKNIFIHTTLKGSNS
ncbi:hypothetical protein J6590_044167 [Homalodisca vitripennis]|nr:hypothetical protein J6590_044167 [Homalodisca vitripennis]